jgi:hypothetical protein
VGLVDKNALNARTYETMFVIGDKGLQGEQAHEGRCWGVDRGMLEDG